MLSEKEHPIASSLRMAMNITYGQNILAEANYVPYANAFTWIYSSFLLNQFNIDSLSSLCAQNERFLEKFEKDNM